MIAAYREPRAKGRELTSTVTETVSSGVPAALKELRRLGRTLKRRAVDVRAYFDRPGTSNGPAEAINGLRNTCADRRSGSAPDELHRTIAARDRRI